MNFEKITNKKSDLKGPKYYKPHRMSFNNKDAGRVINNKYSNGVKKYKASDDSKPKTTQNSEKEKEDEVWEGAESKIELLDNEFNYKNISYQQKQNTLISNWKTVLDDIYNVMLENEATPSNATCFNCGDSAVLRCLDCGPKIFYCSLCFGNFHHKINLFHRTVIIENFQFQSNDIKLPQSCEGNCEHSIIRILTIHLKGN